MEIGRLCLSKMLPGSQTENIILKTENSVHKFWYFVAGDTFFYCRYGYTAIGIRKKYSFMIILV